MIKLSYPPQTTAAGAPTSPGAAAASATTTNIERDLAKEGRAVVYGIYFDFASDRIKEESDAVVAEIAGVLQKNPAWSLAVEGHTDNIGGDPYNLDLSKRRSSRRSYRGTRRMASDYKRTAMVPRVRRTATRRWRAGRGIAASSWCACDLWARRRNYVYQRQDQT